ncbi:MAG: type IX secretion system protein PorQ [Saprospiraceae bacterium]|nr:type IX secretion system protein PorQ [Saprospiraceae bacterium]
MEKKLIRLKTEDNQLFMSKLLRFYVLSTAFVLGAFAPNAQAQITGGRHVFEFLSLPVSARVTALGGAQAAVRDDDPVFAAANPAALNPLMHGRLTFNHNFFLSDIQHGYVAYAHHLEKIGFTVQGGLQYIKYGEMQRADEFGNLQGNFKAGESAFTLGAARALTDQLSVGLNLRLGVSTLDVYQASALLADAGVMYADTAKRFTVGLVVRNAGAQMATYNDLREPLPLDVQLAFTKRLKHLPFRFGVVAHHLHEWDIRYDDPNLQDEEVLFFGEEQPQENKAGVAIDNFFRHLIFNGEFLLGKNESFRLRFGYNHLRKRELTVRNYRSLAGFSGGIGVKIKRFRVDFGYASYHLAGGVAHLGVGTNLRDFF